MFFGLFNTLDIFQKYVNKILVEKLNIFVIIYVNDILIYIKNPSQLHIEVVYYVLDQL